MQKPVKHDVKTKAGPSGARAGCSKGENDQQDLQQYLAFYELIERIRRGPERLERSQTAAASGTRPV